MSIDHYISGPLTSRLARYKLPKHVMTKVTQDIWWRLTSLASIWSDELNRATILFPSLEEAIFYEPLTASVSIRCLVNFCVRNSFLEDLSSDNLARKYGLNCQSQIIPDTDIRVFTEEAINYFTDNDFSAASGHRIPKDYSMNELKKITHTRIVPSSLWRRVRAKK
ncbi:hypothetical protein [Pelosinus sp. sgz500959]|uniref:hypothetical protein n=1 Tax=Pelosinus sp. sgz500959 TaxID=3242472 RepID=UPI0036713E24